MDRITMEYDIAVRIMVAGMMKTAFTPFISHPKGHWVTKRPTYPLIFPDSVKIPISGFVELNAERVAEEKLAVIACVIFYKGFPIDVGELYCFFDKGIYFEYYNGQEKQQIKLVDAKGTIVSANNEDEAFDKLSNLLRLEIGVIDAYLNRKGNKNAA